MPDEILLYFDFCLGQIWNKGDKDRGFCDAAIRRHLNLYVDLS